MKKLYKTLFGLGWISIAFQVLMIIIDASRFYVNLFFISSITLLSLSLIFRLIYNKRK
jgi:hypothetical protein